MRVCTAAFLPHSRAAWRWIGAGIGLLLIAAMAQAGAATAASYEQNQTFGVFAPGESAGGAFGLAVNVSGAGGVPAGSVVAVSRGYGGHPDWGLLRCFSSTGVLFSESLLLEGGPHGVAVDPESGEIYVLVNNIKGAGQVEVFSPDCSTKLSEFGSRPKAGDPEKTIQESPAELHLSPSASGIAAGKEGTVYVADLGFPIAAEATAGGQLSRVMVFKNGVYTGRQHDIAASRSGDTVNYFPQQLALDAAEDLYTGNEFGIYEFAPSNPATPICGVRFSGGVEAMTVDAETREVVYVNVNKAPNGRQLKCNEATGLFEPSGQFAITPAPTGAPQTLALAMNPSLALLLGRPPGTLYAATGLGYIFVQPESRPPLVESESVSHVTSSGARLGALVNPNGPATSYAFQYLDEAAYEANEPDERQSLTVSATGGTFVVGFEGQQTGGSAEGSLSSGSETVSALITAKGTGDLSAATGTGTFSAGSQTITGLTTSTGAFAVGQRIKGAGIPGATLITSTSATTLSLSKPVTESGAGAELQAGSTVVTGLSTALGRFVAGQRLSGAGIPTATTILDASATSLTLSNPVEADATAVALSSAGPLPLAVGQRISGPGIPPGTTIAAAEIGSLTLSQAATATTAATALRAGLPFDATAGQLRGALAGLSSISGVGGTVKVSGGPGDAGGSSPYAIVFGGALGNTALPEVTADGSDLSGGSASATVATLHDGGGGFSAGAREVPLGGALLGTGLNPLAASVPVSGLAPETEYRYRVVATSSDGSDAGLTESFRTYPVEVAGPPDGRAYELVSPADKHGGEVFPINPSVASCGGECKPGAFLTQFTMRSAPDGEAVAYEGTPFSPSEGGVQENEYLARRTASGWQTAVLTPALQSSGEGSGYRALSADLSRGVIKQIEQRFSSEAPAGFANLYAQGTAAPSSLSPLLKLKPSGGASVASFKLRYAGASADLSRIFFEANYTVPVSTGTAAANGGAAKYNLYEWAAGQTRLVNVNPNGSTTSGAHFGAAASGNESLSSLSHAISDDGTRVFWTSQSGDVNVRIDGSETEKIEAPGAFLTASTDGSKVLLAEGCLYDLATKACEDLTKDKGGVSRGGFEGILGAGDDLSRIYFVDTEALTGESEGNANPDGPEHAEAGRFNLYAWQEGGLSYVATLPGVNKGVEEKNWAPSPNERTAEASQNGRWLAFLSPGTHTGYDNIGPCKVISGTGVFESGPCGEAFLYDAATGSLLCPSCNPSGARPLGPTNLPRIDKTGGIDSSVPQPRYLNNAGRLYFDTQDSLSPFDSNGGGQAGHAVEDVYQYEPQGIGGCARAAGCVAMISSGSEPLDSNFVTVDASGKNVFFTTRARLVATDSDELFDLYDAREGGGFSAGKSPGECRGEACQPSPSPVVAPAPSSIGYEGSGNVKSCKKGKVKKHGRCVKKHKKKAKKHRRKHRRAKAGGSR